MPVYLAGLYSAFPVPRHLENAVVKISLNPRRAVQGSIKVGIRLAIRGLPGKKLLT